MSADSFSDLHALSAWFAGVSGRRTRPDPVPTLARRLGATAIPLLGRELQGLDLRRREAARATLAMLAHTPVRQRLVDELRRIAHDACDDEAKVCALGLLAELGEQASASFHDPVAIRRRSAAALAARLDTAADLASAADFMVRQLSPGDLNQMVEVMLEMAPAAAGRLVDELEVRLDLAAAQREHLRSLVVERQLDGACVAGPYRPIKVNVLVDAAARIVVVCSRKLLGERTWRRWAVLVGPSGRIDDCLHEDAADGDAAALVVSLCADGYRVASHEVDHAHKVVAAAARLTAREPCRLPSGYYLGRDLLELGNVHLAAHPRDPSAGKLGRAIELHAAGDLVRARQLLACCDPASGDVAAALAACWIADGNLAAAVECLERAIATEPTWALHHWNLAVALHQLGDDHGCYHALHRFVVTSAAPTGLYGDAAQPGRVARAERMLAELERRARLAGVMFQREALDHPAKAQRSGPRRQRSRTRTKRPGR